MFFQIVFLIMIARSAEVTNLWSHALKDVPKDARKLIELHLRCSSLGVDDFKYPTLNNKAEYEKNKCKSRFDNIEQLRFKYKQSSKILNLLDCADLSISEPGQCPD